MTSRCRPVRIDRYLEGTLPNGLAFARNGDIVVSNFGTDRLELVRRSDGHTTVIVDKLGGKEIGKVDQSNPVPVAATKGTWAGFGDIVAMAAVEGILELIEKANSRPR